ncbi:hypothetical protein [Leifsonia sp. Leaf264]|uniref:hypothetical protein n=1 Tax=Leifsonia sp. Leaf264 TaxID=1736314 RepID=UPI0006FB4177|nr:hypothetical protein [Leifsonia sp. Leaf264]KQO98680.1 hypothetical protein ASF30_11500 [Leifsonia sp. Leaf264]
MSETNDFRLKNTAQITPPGVSSGQYATQNLSETEDAAKPQVSALQLRLEALDRQKAEADRAREEVIVQIIAERLAEDFPNVAQVQVNLDDEGYAWYTVADIAGVELYDGMGDDDLDSEVRHLIYELGMEWDNARVYDVPASPEKSILAQIESDGRIADEAFRRIQGGTARGISHVVKNQFPTAERVRLVWHSTDSSAAVESILDKDGNVLITGIDLEDGETELPQVDGIDFYTHLEDFYLIQLPSSDEARSILRRDQFGDNTDIVISEWV